MTQYRETKLNGLGATKIVSLEGNPHLQAIVVPGPIVGVLGPNLSALEAFSAAWANHPASPRLQRTQYRACRRCSNPVPPELKTCQRCLFIKKLREKTYKEPQLVGGKGRSPTMWSIAQVMPRRGNNVQ